MCAQYIGLNILSRVTKRLCPSRAYILTVADGRQNFESKSVFIVNLYVTDTDNQMDRQTDTHTHYLVISTHFSKILMTLTIKRDEY